MRVKSVILVHALVFTLGLPYADGHGMTPMDSDLNFGSSIANIPVEAVDIQQRSSESPIGSFEQNPNIDYDSLSKEELLRMFLRLEEQNRQQTPVLQEQLTRVIAQNEEYKHHIESLEAVY